MTTCETCPCTEQGIDRLQIILNNSLNKLVGLGVISLGDVLLIKASFNTFKCTLPEDLQERLTVYINRITNELSTTTGNTNLYYIIIIFVTLLILIILIYLTIYFNNNTYTLSFGVLSVIIIISSAIILYFLINSSFSNAKININTNLEQLENLLCETKNAFANGFCVIGGCKQGISC